MHSCNQDHNTAIRGCPAASMRQRGLSARQSSVAPCRFFKRRGARALRQLRLTLMRASPLGPCTSEMFFTATVGRLLRPLARTGADRRAARAGQGALIICICARRAMVCSCRCVAFAVACRRGTLMRFRNTKALCRSAARWNLYKRWAKGDAFVHAGIAQCVPACRSATGAARQGRVSRLEVRVRLVEKTRPWSSSAANL